ncbi:hypothetical protein [Alkalibacillus haloalkaliphilus]|uniref:hypothetical protein n=1 Tax=Alkalibacillus haloalkaliphilus TaxID=94136 RepID=UPI002936B1B8|nr:hypothetical protein [Alkalibacillus haloalkaliphilus]MDV2582926.1 hypothetical protein [Alkalibacillus haloalkaliphilus]
MWRKFLFVWLPIILGLFIIYFIYDLWRNDEADFGFFGQLMIVALAGIFIGAFIRKFVMKKD